MLQFNRRVEYGLGIVAQMMRAGPGSLHSARSVSEATRIPFDMVSKCLQRLHRGGLCEAVHGKHGGYRLSCDPAAISLGRFIATIFEEVAVAECLSRPEDADCQLLSDCGLRLPMQRLNERIRGVLEDMSLAEFLGIDASAPRRS